MRIRPIAVAFTGIAICSLAALGLLVVVVSTTPIVTWWATALAGPWNDPKGDVLIVPSGGTSGHDFLTQASYLRADYAAAAYREGFRQVVLTGGGTPHSEAVLMSRVMQCVGVPANVITTETVSTSTRENALNTARLLHDVSGTKVLLTSDYHMFRAHRAFRKAGLEVRPRPIPDARKRATRWSGRWPAFLDLAVETVKIAYYWGRGWI